MEQSTVDLVDKEHRARVDLKDVRHDLEEMDIELDKMSGIAVKDAEFALTKIQNGFGKLEEQAKKNLVDSTGKKINNPNEKYLNDAKNYQIHIQRFLNSMKTPSASNVEILEQYQNFIANLKGDIGGKEPGLIKALDSCMSKAYTGLNRFGECVSQAGRAIGNAVKLAWKCLAWLFCRVMQAICKGMNALMPDNTFWKESEKGWQKSAQAYMSDIKETSRDLYANHTRFQQIFNANSSTDTFNRLNIQSEKIKTLDREINGEVKYELNKKRDQVGEEDLIEVKNKGKKEKLTEKQRELQAQKAQHKKDQTPYTDKKEAAEKYRDSPTLFGGGKQKGVGKDDSLDPPLSYIKK